MAAARARAHLLVDGGCPRRFHRQHLRQPYIQPRVRTARRNVTQVLRYSAGKGDLKEDEEPRQHAMYHHSGRNYKTMQHPP
eukprot:1608153-Prymnesium_polylepis.1